MAKVKSKRFHLVSLGCSKNTVDSESMAHLLGQAGYQATTDPRQAEVLIVNTCGFIGPAKQESVAVLNQLASGKKRGQMLIAAGCLSQRYGAELMKWVPGLDGLIGTRRWMDIVDFVQRLRERRRPEPLYHLPDDAKVVGSDEHSALRAAVQGASAYLKIADGCRRPCAFCAIPLIKGTAVSRPMESILAEARALEAQGVRELILIAQDTTDYGHDLGMKDGLAALLEGIAEAAPGIDWTRVMYAYPGYVTDRLIETMAARPQITHYLDMPLQHGHPMTLRRMRRPANITWVHQSIAKMRAAMPDLALRSTFIVGYPGETEEEFQALLDFVEELKFDRLGAFTFSYEPGTESAALGDPIPEAVKQERKDRLMALQQRLSLAKNQALVGKTLNVLVEGQGDGLSIGRTYRDAPEIDGVVVIDGEAPVGEMVPVRISGALAYDLSGTVETASAQAVTAPLGLVNG
ncbi:MAG TPA: 30S ribosomal protein S12 methylthiotransferase RimO [Anaerolineales bacterium]|nr:30S ribosomal protein S12 methylthiotransferase RimO [Anaerolineales bacterium]